MKELKTTQLFNGTTFKTKPVFYLVGDTSITFMKHTHTYYVSVFIGVQFLHTYFLKQKSLLLAIP